MTTVGVNGSGESVSIDRAASARGWLLDLHAAARRNPGLQRLAVISRMLLAMGFIPTGLLKLMNERFTVLPIESPVGFFFEAMYRTGAYWQFIGAAQVLAGVLILIPRTATLGAVLFFPIILNISVITTSMQFVGTPLVTAGMLLASTFLLCWDYDRFERVLFEGGRRREDRWGGPGSMLERLAFTVGGAAGLLFFLGTRGFVPRAAMYASMPLGAAAALIVAFAWIRAWRAER